MIEWMAEVFFNIAILIDTILENTLSPEELHESTNDKEQQL